MITFQTHVIRYFPYAMRSVGIMKKIVRQTVKPPQIPEATLRAMDEVLPCPPDRLLGLTLLLLLQAKDWADLHAAVKRDFWVTTPCRSTLRPVRSLSALSRLSLSHHAQERWLEGTRLTIQTANPEGFEFSIRTPGTPPRWAEFEDELAHVRRHRSSDLLYCPLLIAIP